MSKSTRPPRDVDAMLESRRRGVLAEAWAFLIDHKKWWLVPLALGLVIFGALVLSQGTAAGPFIYALF